MLLAIAHCSKSCWTYLLRAVVVIGLGIAGFLFSTGAAAGLFLAAAAAVGAVAEEEDAAGRREVRLVFAAGALGAAGFGAAAGFVVFTGLGFGMDAVVLGFVGVFGAALGSGLLAGATGAFVGLAVEMDAGFLSSGFLITGVPFAFALSSAGAAASAAGSWLEAVASVAVGVVGASETVVSSVGAAGRRASSS